MRTRSSGGLSRLVAKLLGLFGRGPRARSMTSEQSVQPTHPTNPDRSLGYEGRDADVPVITWALIGFAIVGFVGTAILWFGFNFLASYFTPPAPTSPLETIRQTPPGPVLQTRPAVDEQRFLASQQEFLSQYAWVNQQAGVVRIPIDQAMQLTLQRGLPTRPNARLPESNAQGVFDEGHNLDSEGGAPPGQEPTAGSE
jgi:hypothetical protein